MLQLHTESEIKSIYRQAKNKPEFPKIYAQLNACPVDYICKILGIKPVRQNRFDKDIDEAVKTAEKLAKRMELYKQGKSDREIATIEGGKIVTIQQWRHKRDLDVNKPYVIANMGQEVNLKGISKHEQGHQAKMTLYLNGYDDSRIARLLCCTRNNIRMWRIKNNLDNNR